MFDRKSIYALNKKDPDAIVCPDTKGNLHRLTRADFDSEEEFKFWKTWSDQDYWLRDRGDTEENDNTVSIEMLSDLAVSEPNVEELLICKEDNKKRERKNAMLIAWIRSCLTDRQFRRLFLYHGKAMTEAKISALESVGQQRISNSIVSAEKKIKKIFSEIEKK